MLEGLKVLLLSAFISLHLVVPKHASIQANQQKLAVKAVSVHKTISTTIAPTSTTTSQSVSRPITATPNTTTQKKQYGAWYWQSNLGRSQMWVGTDAQGKDIFVDQLPTPTISQPPQPPQLTTDAEKQACLEKVEAEYANQKPAGCQTWTDQYDNQRTNCSEVYMPEFYKALGTECGIHTRGG